MISIPELVVLYIYSELVLQFLYEGK